MSDTYVCEACQGTFVNEPTWSDDDAAAEYEDNFDKQFDKSVVVVLCDDCYKLAMERIECERS